MTIQTLAFKSYKNSLYKSTTNDTLDLAAEFKCKTSTKDL